MSNRVDMNVFLHSLLIRKQMNDFTVSEARDALLKEHDEFKDETEARKFIYRQLCRNIEKGLLVRKDCFDDGSKKVIYSKTDKLLASSVAPIKRGSRKKKITIRKEPIQVPLKNSYEAELKKELLAYEIDLNTTLEEAKEYNRLSERFPELQEKLKEHQSQAKDKSIKLLGKINALQNLLSYTVTGYKAC